MKRMTTILGLLILIVVNTFSFDISSTIFDQKIDNGEGYKEIIFKNKFTENVRYKVKVLKGNEKDKDMSKWA